MSTENTSHKIKEALRQRFLGGTSKLADRKCYGYDRAANSLLLVNQKEAGVVKWIFESYRNGVSFGKITKELEKQGIPSPTGRGKWNREAISKLLSTEKYVGSVLLQKQGELERVLIRNHHPAIFSSELFESVQHAKPERSKEVANRHDSFPIY